MGSDAKIVQAGHAAFDAWEMSCVTQADKVRADKVRHMVVVLEDALAAERERAERLEGELQVAQTEVAHTNDLLAAAQSERDAHAEHH